VIVGRRGKPPFIREITRRDLKLALEQCFAYADRGDVQIITPDGKRLVMVSIAQWDRLNAANRS
jgi:hypothetical protein